jgi:hypothetical protein
MNKFSITIVSLAAMSGFALAQQKPADPKAGSAGGGAAVGAGATVKAGAGGAGAAGSAAAGAKATAGATAQATPAVEKPKPPAEIKDFLKQMGTRMKCTGTSVGPDMKSEVKMTTAGGSRAARRSRWAPARPPTS